MLTEFDKDKVFTLSLKNGNYSVRYTLTPINENSCELEYYEWVDSGELEEPFTMEILGKLKFVLESQKTV